MVASLLTVMSLGPILEIFGAPDVASRGLVSIYLKDYQLKTSGPDNDQAFYVKDFFFIQIGPLNWKAYKAANPTWLKGTPGDIASNVATGYFRVASAGWPLNVYRTFRFINWSESDTTGLVLWGAFDTLDSSTEVLKWP